MRVRWLFPLVAGFALSSLPGCGAADPQAFTEAPEEDDAFEGDDEDVDLGEDVADGVDPLDADDVELGGEEEEGDEEGKEPVEDDTTAPEPQPKSPPAPTPLKPFRVMTYNVRHPTADDKGIYTWNKRKAAVVARILANAPDIVGVQEASSGADKDLIAGLTGANKPYGVFRPSKSGSPKLIFFRKARFTYHAATGKGNQALPNPYAKSHACHSNASGRRAAWVGLREKASQKVFLFVNAHITHGSKCEAGRLEQARAIKQLVNAKGKGLSKIVMGDFNTDPQATSTKGEKTISILESAGLTRTAKHAGTTSKSEATFNSNWKKTGWKGSARLDWIFHSGGAIASTAPAIDRKQANGISPSDHFGVLATIRLK